MGIGVGVNRGASINDLPPQDTISSSLYLNPKIKWNLKFSSVICRIRDLCFYVWYMAVVLSGLPLNRLVCAVCY